MNQRRKIKKKNKLKEFAQRNRVRKYWYFRRLLQHICCFLCFFRRFHHFFCFYTMSTVISVLYILKHVYSISSPGCEQFFFLSFSYFISFHILTLYFRYISKTWYIYAHNLRKYILLKFTHASLTFIFPL